MLINNCIISLQSKAYYSKLKNVAKVILGAYFSKASPKYDFENPDGPITITFMFCFRRKRFKVIYS